MACRPSVLGCWAAACLLLGGCHGKVGSPAKADGPSAADRALPTDKSGESGGCTPRVCTPCDCGNVADGCGATLDCGPCAEPRPCAEIYGDVPGFLLCEETAEHCRFNATKGGSKSCTQVCADHRGACLAAFGNGPGSCAVNADGQIGCEVADHDDDICVCTRKTADYSPLPCAGDAGPAPADGAPAADQGPPPPTGKTLRYRVTFEAGSTAAATGTSKVETMSGGAVTAVANPHQDARNGSARVGRHKLPAGYTRAELSSQRLPTENKTYIYKVSYYIPTSFFSAAINWNLISQWKTWPCGDHDGYDAQICGSCGIFDDLSAKPTYFQFKYRAEPDCYDARPPLETGQWIDLVQQIRWTNSATGFVKVWKNGALVYEKQGFKTLFDGFDPARCNMYWAVGLYANSAAGLELFTDDIEIWE